MEHDAAELADVKELLLTAGERGGAGADSSCLATSGCEAEVDLLIV